MSNKNKEKDGRLPLTRKEQVWYLIKSELGVLFLTNIVSFLFTLPLILVFLFGSITFHQYTLDASKTMGDYFNLFLMYGLLVIPTSLIMGLGRCGLTSVIKQMVFESSAKFSTFFVGFKKNFKAFFTAYLLLGVLAGALVVNFGYLRYIEGNMTFKGILFGANCLLLFTLILSLPNIEFEGVTFNNYLFAYYRNGLYMFYRNFPASLLNLLLYITPIVLIFFVPIKVFFIPLGILATFYIALSSLISFILSIQAYEKYVPKEQLEGIYHKGLEDINL